MGGMTLLQEARLAGLTVTVDGERLVIHGPKSAKAVARRLLIHKAEVMAALIAPEPSLVPNDTQAINNPAVNSDNDPLDEAYFAQWTLRPDCNGRLGWCAPGHYETKPFVPFDDLSEPGEPCLKCGSLEMWWDVTGKAHCQHCESRSAVKSETLAKRAAHLRSNKEKVIVAVDTDSTPDYK